MTAIKMVFSVSGKTNFDPTAQKTYPDLNTDIKNEIIRILSQIEIIVEAYIDIKITNNEALGLVTIVCKRNILKSKMFYKEDFPDAVAEVIRITLKAMQFTEIEVNVLYASGNSGSEEEAMVPVINMKASTVILFITTLNIMLFIGGTIYSDITVKSIQKRYEEAQEKIDSARSKYKYATLDLANAKVIFQNKLSDFDTIPSGLNKKKQLVLDSLEKGSQHIKDEIATINKTLNDNMNAMGLINTNANTANSLNRLSDTTQKRFNSLQKAINKMRYSADSANTRLTKINETLKDANSKSKIFNFNNVWNYSTWWTRIALFGPILFLLLIDVLFYFKIKSVKKIALKRSLFN